VTNEAFNGHQKRNPFNFHHFNVNEISLYLDGQQQEGIKPMELNYTDSHYIRAYNTLFSGTGNICRDEVTAIDRNDYALLRCITKATMFVKKVKLSPSVFLAHAKALENGTANILLDAISSKFDFSHKHDGLRNHHSAVGFGHDYAPTLS